MLCFNCTFHQDAHWTQNTVNALPHLLTWAMPFIYFKDSKIHCMELELICVAHSSLIMHFLARCKKAEPLSHGFKFWFSSLKALWVTDLGVPHFHHLSSGGYKEKDNFWNTPASRPALSRTWIKLLLLFLLSGLFAILLLHKTRFT